ncbi:MAG: GNAT family N-acetyltransferase [Holophagaceae bacterium]|nr:GNAT family N-acetyltransferase [Holophagaceae bacterium]
MLKIRKATPADIPLILAYIRELAEYERAPERAVAQPEDIARHMFAEAPLIHCELAEWEGKDAGFALYFFNFSTWEGKAGLYLEDLFVRPEFRGCGIGKALLQRLARIAVDRGCTRYVWQVLDWNTPSIEFYEAMGAKVMRDWLTCRVEGDALKKLAEGAP